MTKGRDYVPSPASEGIWFRHRGEPGDIERRLRGVTSTRKMMEAPFSAPVVPRSPPLPFKHKEEPDYKTGNPFTQHDNRHYFQEHGEYFGNGRDSRYLGKRLYQTDRRLHHTDEGFLHHRSRNPILHDYNPITATSYRAPEPVEPTRRRFPRIYKSSQKPENITETTDWKATSFRTPLHVLAVSQEPFPKNNSWKYSFHGKSKVYPPYDRKSLPHVPNILNRYGADFASAPAASAE